MDSAAIDVLAARQVAFVGRLGAGFVGGGVAFFIT
jgi:hypothetical protein